MTTHLRTVSLASLSALAALFGATRAAAQQPATAHGIESVAWMAGCWERRAGDRVYEEQWMAPRGGSMPGSSRTVRAGAEVAHELLRVAERGGRLVYAAHPSGQAPAEFQSTIVAGDSVVFENPTHDFPRRIVYRRTPGDSLHARVEGPGDDGRTQQLEFRMGRAACPGTAGEAVRDAVLAELERYYANFSARDWAAFAHHFWPGATLATVWQPPGESTPRVVVTTVPEFVAQAPQGPGSRSIFEERMLSAEVRASGGVAHVWARYAARFGDPGDVVEWTGIDAITLIEHAGRWRIVSIAYASD